VFLVNIILDEMSSALAPATAILASGGLTQSDAVCRRLADVADLRVIRAEDPEATARGVAWLAFDRAEPWSSGAATRELEPGIDVALRTRARRYRSELERALGLEA